MLLPRIIQMRSIVFLVFFLLISYSFLVREIGEHFATHPPAHSERRGGRHVQREALRAPSEVRHDPRRAECVRSLRGYLGTFALHTG